MAAPHLLEITNLRHGFDSTPVLTDINLTIDRGEFVVLVGASGCGKSTLLQLLLGAEQPLSGRVILDGVQKKSPDQRCGVIYQKYSVYPHLTVLENILFGLNAGRPTGAQCIRGDDPRITHYLRQVGLEDAIHKYPYQLSGGMEQRVAIAQALIVNPEILLLDEPFSALDSWLRQQLQQFLISLYQKQNITIVFVTHDLQEAATLATRIIALAPITTSPSGSHVVLDIPITEPHPRSKKFILSSEGESIIDRIRQATVGTIGKHAHRSPSL